MTAFHPLPAPGPGAPSPPIQIAGGAAAASARLGAERVDVPDAVLGRLRGACADMTEKLGKSASRAVAVTRRNLLAIPPTTSQTNDQPVLFP